MDKAEFKRKISEYTYRTLHWGNRRLPPGIRTVCGFLFMVGGVFGFLPVLGFWMFPLGVAFVALDVPPARRRLDVWMERLHRDSEIEDDHVGLDHPTSNQ
jgi:hypothetical protein